MTAADTLRRLAQRTRDERIRRRLTQGDLAAQAGVSARTVSSWEQTGRASLEVLVLILTALGYEDRFLEVIPDPGVSPLAELKQAQRKPRRVRHPQQAAEQESWQWGDPNEESE